MSKEAMKLALDLATMHHSDDGYQELRQKVRRVAKAALAEQPALRVVDCHATGVCVQSGLRAEQPAQQEPEWYHFVRYGEDCFVPYSGQAPEKATPLYTSPQRTWVGLTDEEILEAWCIHLDEGDEDEIEEWRHVINEAREIEAKLKEKNT